MILCHDSCHNLPYSAPQYQSAVLQAANGDTPIIVSSAKQSSTQYTLGENGYVCPLERMGGR